MKNPRELLIYGSRDFGQVVREHALACGYSFAGFVDDWHAGPEVLGGFETVCSSHPAADYAMAIAIGYNHLAARRAVATRTRLSGYHLPPLVHPEAFVFPGSKVESGSIVMARACVDMRVRVGVLSVLWPAAIISHDSILLGNTFLSPNVTVCGHCTIGIDSFLGAGSIVVDHVEVPEGTVLKAGEVLTAAGLKRSPRRIGLRNGRET